MFSATFRYALICLLDLAAADQGVQANVIASRHNLSGRYLAIVLAELKRLGVVVSQKGRQGGYRLTRPAAEINLLRLYQGLAGSGNDPISSTLEGAAEVEVADRWLQEIEGRWKAELARTSLNDLR